MLGGSQAVRNLDVYRVSQVDVLAHTFAMAHCTAVHAAGSGGFAGRVRAVPRNACDTLGSCNDLCDGLTGVNHPTATCFGAIHIYETVLDGVSGGLDGNAGMEAYQYTSSGCDSTSCGPNFCCCGTNI